MPWNPRPQAKALSRSDALDAGDPCLVSLPDSAYRLPMSQERVSKRQPLSYLNPGGGIRLPRGGSLTDAIIDKAIASTNELFERLADAAPYVFGILGMRNLSAFVGEAFAAELETASNGLLRLNPHQDGYPDLLLMDDLGRAEFERASPRAKQPFSPFVTGGIEVKATCGDVPTEKQLAKQGLSKPGIGEPKVDLVKGFNWKAHHRETNHLVGVIWDFIDELPTLAAVTYCNGLAEDDWGKIVQPRAGGGRTTSVSIMTKAGVRKMCANTIRVLPGPYASLLERNGMPKQQPY